ncbi:MAG TPA: 4a-hydroxytetrahydrobiopterin dehydratase [Pyrinomonadaceae bacterium]|nr:4a-hydroxytetrahydrobiopterin dehydratase [Pyrinomonadaceae bacterium]
MESLTSRHCVPCHAGTPRLSEGEAEALLARLRGWSIVAGHHLTKEYRFADFRGALAFVVRVGEVAEREDHHPDIEFGWGYARLNLHTHATGGLTENDFVLAAHLDALEAVGG